MPRLPLTRCPRRHQPVVVSKRVITALAWRLPCISIGGHANAIYVRNSHNGAADGGRLGLASGDVGCELQPGVRHSRGSRPRGGGVTPHRRPGMSSQPGKILLVTEQPLLALSFRELLEAAGWNTGPILLRPEQLETSLDPETSALVMIDAEAGLPWPTYTSLCSRSPLSRFVVWCTTVTPQAVQAAMEAGVHGLLSV